MSGASRDVVIVAGAMARRPGVGGHAWVFLHWLVGLDALGYDVVFVDRLDGDATVGTRWVHDVLTAGAPFARHAVLTDDGVVGMTRHELRAACARSVVLLNFMGYLRDDDLLGAARCRVFVDLDPGWPQMWAALGLHDGLAGHDAFVTLGTNIGSAGCAVPECRRRWIATLPPVAPACWRDAGADGPSDRRITSVATWRGPDGPVEYGGVTYGTRVHEFRRFLALPQAAGGRFELALAIDPAETRDRAALRAHGWRLVDPASVASTPAAYRDYVQASAVEIMIAKAMYVRARTGWVSDRSACYLAAGRPVVAQDTGAAADLLPVGEGLLTFTTVEEAAEAIAEVRAGYERHAKAARALAEEHFEARRVVHRVLAAVGVR